MFKKNRIPDRYILVVILGVLISGVGWLGYRSLVEVVGLNTAIDTFYNKPYSIRNDIYEFHHTIEQFEELWIHHHLGTESTPESDSVLSSELLSRLQTIDSLYSGIIEHFKTHELDLNKFEDAFATFSSGIHALKESGEYRIIKYEDHLQLTAAKNKVLNELSPFEKFAQRKAVEIFQQTISERSNLIKQLGIFVFVVILILILTGASIGVVLFKKNQRIEKAQNRFKDFILYAPIPIMIHQDGKVLLTSESWHISCGYTRDELTTIDDWIKKADADKEFKEKKEYINRLYEINDHQDDGIWNVKTKEGLIRKWHFFTGPLDDRTVISIGLDVTEEYEATNKLKLFKSAIDQSPVSIVITDKEGKIEFVNRFFTTITGYTNNEVLGKTPNILKSGEHGRSLYENLWDTITQGEIWSGEMINKSKSGELFWESSTISPIFNEAGTLTNFVAVKEDISERKKMEEEAQRREHLLNDIQEISRTGGWEYDVKKNEMSWTPSLYYIHGYNSDQHSVHITETLSCYSAKDRKLFLKKFQKCKHHGVNFDLTLPFTDFNGLKKWVRTKARPVWNGRGEIEKILGVVTDVTEEKLREQILIENEHKFSAVVNSFEDIVFTLDRDQKITALYGSLVEELPFDEEEIIGRRITDLLGHESGAIHEQNVFMALQGETVRTSHSSTIFSDDGQELRFDLTLSPLFDHSGSITGVLGVSRNVTQQYVYQKLLQEAKERYQHALAGTQAGTWDWDLKTGTLFLNERWAEIVGYTLEELKPISIKTWQDLLCSEDIGKSEKLLDEHFSGKTDFYDCKLRMKHKDGHNVWVWDRGQVVERDASGNPLRMVGTHIDINAWMTAENLLRISEKRYRDLFSKSADASLLIKMAFM